MKEGIELETPIEEMIEGNFMSELPEEIDAKTS